MTTTATTFEHTQATGDTPTSSDAVRIHALRWGGLGFLLGALFWHFVGFWSFVSGVVLHGRDDAQPVAVQRKNDVRLVEAKLLEARTAQCIKLIRSRDGAQSRAELCSAADRKLPDAGLARRTDMAASPAGWAVTATTDR